MLIRLFQTMRRFDMEVQPQLVLLQKTLLNIEGLGRELYPELDLWTTAKPYLEGWMREQLGAKAIYTHWRENLAENTRALIDLPRQASRVLDDAAAGRLRVHWESPQLDRLHEEIRRGNRRRVRAILFGAALIALAVLLT